MYRFSKVLTVISIWCVSLFAAAPVITSTAVTSATEDAMYSYTASATDADNDVLTWSVKSGTTLPSWLTFSATGSNSTTPFVTGISGTPGGVGYDENTGYTYFAVTDANGTIYKADANGTKSVFGTVGGSSPFPVGNMIISGTTLYVSCYSAGKIVTFDLTDQSGSAAPTLLATLAGPVGMALKGGELYVASYNSSKIVKVNMTNGTLTDFLSVAYPFGLVFNSTGDCYISQFNAHKVLKRTIAGDTSTVATLVSSTSDIKIGRNGKFYISQRDVADFRIYESDFSTYQTIAVKSWGMTFNNSGTLIFGEYNGSRLLKLETGSVIFGTPTNENVGTHNVALSVTDGTTTVDQLFTITVANTNDAPASSNDTISVTTQYAFASTDFTFTDIDPTSDVLTSVKITALPVAGILKYFGTNVTVNKVVPKDSLGQLTYTPAAAGHGIPYTTFGFQVGDGAAYSSSYIMTVNATTIPTVTTSAVSSITTTTSTLGGNVLSDGSVSVAERGIVYSTTDSTPEVGETGVIKDVNGTGTGIFSKSISNLTAGTIYHVRAYASNSVGTGYGAKVTFSTTALPVAATIAEDQAMTETNLDARSINVTISNDSFIDNALLNSNFTFTHAPAGCSIESINYTDATHCVVNIAFDGTDFDFDVANLGIIVDSTELARNITTASSNQLAITATNDPESISIASDGTITEGTENGEIISVTLTGGTFATSVTTDNWTLTNLPVGVNKGAVTRVNATTVTIALSGNRTIDYDTNITNMKVECSTVEYGDTTGGAALSDTDGVTFTATVETPEPPVIALASNPADSDVICTPSLFWKPSPGANTYRLQVSLNSDFSTKIVDSVMSDTSFTTLKLEGLTQYFWRVAATNNGGQSAFSESDSFTTISSLVLSAPRIPEVANGERAAVDFTATWTRVDSAALYRVEFSADSTFTTTIIDSTLVAPTVLTIRALKNDSRYYYRVAALNGKNSSPWSRIASILTVTPTDIASVAVVAETWKGEAQLGAGLKLSSSDPQFADGMRIEAEEPIQTVVSQGFSDIGAVLDFSGSGKVKFDSTVFITIPVPDTSASGELLDSTEKKLVSAYWIDSTGKVNVIYDAYRDTIGNLIVPTNVLGKLILAVDTLKPAILDSTPAAASQSGSNPRFKGAIIDNIINCQTYAYYRKGGEDHFDSTLVSIDSDGHFDLTINGQQLDQAGFEYFLGAYDGVNRVKFTRTNIPVLVTDQSDTVLIPTAQWHLFAIPLVLEKNNVTDVLTNMGRYGIDWKLFARSLSGVHDSFVEYGPNLNTMSTAYSYWLKTNRTDLILKIDSATNTPVDKCFEFAIPPKSWASIGNPYLFPVGWQAIIDSTGTAATALIGPYTYQDSAWVTPIDIDHIVSWQGNYVYNQSDTTVVLRIPSLRYKSGLSKKTVFDESTVAKRFEWIVSSKTGRDYRNYFGFAKGASDGYDRMTDYPKPGRIEMDGPATWFTRTSLAKVASRFQTDFTNLTCGGAAWNTVVGNLQKGQIYKCSVNFPPSLTDSIGCTLIDRHTGVLYDLKASDYTFTPLENESERPFEIVAGSKTFVESYVRGIRLAPKNLTLANVYPNPVRNMANIRYTLPWSSSGIPVNLSIYDVQGRLAIKLVSQNQESGYYTVNWDLKNSQNKPVATGLYFLRLSTGKQHKLVRLQVVH